MILEFLYLINFKYTSPFWNECHLVLAMVPAVQSGIGVNFNLPLRLLWIDRSISILNSNLRISGFFVAILVSYP